MKLFKKSNLMVTILLISFLLFSCQSFDSINQLIEKDKPIVNNAVNIDNNVNDFVFTILSAPTDFPTSLSMQEMRSVGIKIDSVYLLKDDGTEVLISGDNPEDEIIPDYNNDKIIRLKIVGENFGIEGSNPPKSEDYLFEFDDSVNTIIKTAIGSSPHRQVLLDKSIPFTPVLDTTFTNNEITMELNTKGIPDLYLKGKHILSVKSGKKYVGSINISIGEPEEKVSLNPVIESITVIKDEENKPENLMIIGKHFMFNYKFLYATIDGDYAYGHTSTLLKTGDHRAIIHLPKDFQMQSGTNSITYITPFGATFKMF